MSIEIDHTHKDDNVLRGAILIVVAVFMIAAMNALGKFLSTTLHPVEIVFYRNAVILCGLLFWMKISGNTHLIRTNELKAHAYRASVGTMGVVLAVSTVARLPLADATTLLYTAPLFVTALSYFMLGEQVGPWRLGAVVAGFLGVFFIAAPRGENLPLSGVAFGLSAALFHALTQLQLRKLGRSEHHLTTVFYFMVFGTVFTAPAMPFVFTGPPTMESYIPLALLAFVGVGQQVLKTEGYALAPTAVVTPINYTGLVWAAIFGLVIWHDVPGLGVYLGAGIIISCNLFILWRENYLKRKASA